MTQAPPSLESLMAQVADEFLDRQARGEAPTAEEYCQRYPQIAGFIRQMFPTLAVLRGGDDPADPEGGDAPRRLGDFRIRREVGRGGMGVVYEAEQISLGRRVALKVLPFASALDQRQLARFKTEAQAAGQLHHTHIVPVYFVGEDRGVHFYAMQFIDGRTVADLIHDLRLERHPGPPGESTPPRNALSTLRSGRKPEHYRWVAECGVQAAEALDHAHANGVVHRDIKPANLIRDHAGQVWVTDFGLAQVRTDARLTVTGDVVGTLRYMSPEQALRPTQVDHRSDVYSLGVTLYELLTLRPAFPAEGREELLRQIADREPPPARTADRMVPPELDLILRKAMAKEPDERYPTAKEFADDLRRFLDNRPVLAKRQSAWQYAKKWARRHRQIVTTAVLGLFVALAAAVGVLIAKNAEVRAERRNVVGANDLLKNEIADRKAAETAAQAARDKAQTNFGEYQRAMFTLLEGVRWRRQGSPGGIWHTRTTAEQLVAVLRGLPEALAAEPNIRCLIALARAQEGLAAFLVQDRPAAAAAFTEAEALFVALVAADPSEPLYRAEFAWLLCHRAMAHHVAQDPAAANADWDRAVTELRAGLAAAPTDRKCREVLTETIIMLDRARNAKYIVRRPETLVDALVLAEGLCAESPADPECRFQRARVRGFQTDRRPPADPGGTEAAVRALLPDLRGLVEDHPKAVEYREELFRRLYQLGKLLVAQRRQPEAAGVYREAVGHAREVTGHGPASVTDYHDAASLAVGLGVLVGTTGPKAAEAADLYRYAIECEETALFQDRTPRQRDVYRQSVITQTLLLSRALGSMGKYREAAEAVDRAVRNENGDPQVCSRVATHYGLLAKDVTADPNRPEDQRAAAAEPYYQQSLAALRRAAAAGFTAWAGVRTHPAFAGVKDRPEFKALTAGK